MVNYEFRFKIYEWRAGVERWPLIVVCFLHSAFCHADAGGIPETGYVTIGNRFLAVPSGLLRFAQCDKVGEVGQFDDSRLTITPFDF